MNKIVIGKRVIIDMHHDEINKTYFESKSELCDLIFNLFNSTNYEKVYLTRETLSKDKQVYHEDVGEFYNSNGYDFLKIITVSDNIKLLKAFMYEFGYSKKTNEKKLSLK